MLRRLRKQGRGDLARRPAPGTGVAERQQKAAGTPENVVKVKESYTGQYLKPVLARKPKPANKKQAAE